MRPVTSRDDTVFQNGSGLVSIWNSSWAGNGGALVASSGQLELVGSLILHGDDTGPAIHTRVPTPTIETSWGAIKALYR